MNADIVPITSRYYEAGSKRLETGEKYSGLHDKFSAFKNGCISTHFDDIRLKLSTNGYFEVGFHFMLSKKENSKNRFL